MQSKTDIDKKYPKVERKIKRSLLWITGPVFTKYLRYSNSSTKLPTPHQYTKTLGVCISRRKMRRGRHEG